MKNLIFIVSSFIFVGCFNQSESSIKKTFRGELTLTPAESALLFFDRLVELTNEKEEKKALKKKLKELDLYNKNK